jgi:glycosyltransferase involved in cell wall biosynthesis
MRDRVTVPPRRLLIVAAEFPPVKGIGRLRPLKFCQHLGAFGWESAVLAPAEGAIEPVDVNTLGEIPTTTRVFRAPLPRPKDRIVAIVKSMLGRGEPPSAESIANASPAGGAGRAPRSNLRPGGSVLGGLLGRFDAIARTHLLIPDDIALWCGPATRVGMRAIEDFRPDVILATAPHFTNLFVGAGLSRRSGIPWVADYRDLWTGDVLRAWVPWWRQRLELWLERRLLATASAVTTVSEPKSDVVRSRLSGRNTCPVVTLTNGYDPEEFDGILPEVGDPERFRIVYAGRLFKNRRGYELVEAAGALLRQRPELGRRLSIEYYGGVAPEIADRMARLVEQHALSDVVRFHPDVPYARSKALQKGANALLLIVDAGETSSGVIPGKLFEYVAARRPILCIAAPGATTEIIIDGRLGVAVNPGDIDGVKRAIVKLMEDAASGYRPDEKYLERFERRKLVGRLAQLLDEVARNSGRTGAR